MTHPGPDPLRDAIAREIVAALVDQLDGLQLPRKNFGTTAWWCAQLDPGKQLPYPQRERLAKDWEYATRVLLRAIRDERARRQHEREQTGLSTPPPPTPPVDLDRPIEPPPSG